MVVASIIMGVLIGALALVWFLGVIGNGFLLLARIAGHGRGSGIFLFPAIAGIVASFLVASYFNGPVWLAVLFAIPPDLLFLLGSAVMWIRTEIFCLPAKDKVRSDP